MSRISDASAKQGRKSAPVWSTAGKNLRVGNDGKLGEKSREKVEKLRIKYNKYITREFKKDPLNRKWDKYYHEIDMTTGKINRLPTIPKSASADDVAEALKALETFVRVEQEHAQSIATVTQNLYQNTGYQYTERDKKKVLSIFKSLEWKKMREMYDSSVVLDDVSVMIEKGMSAKDIKKLMRDYIRSDKNVSFSDYVTEYG